MLTPFASIGEAMTQVGSAIAGLMVAYAMFQNYFPYELRGPIKKFRRKIVNLFYPFIVITFPEYQGDGFERSKAFAAIERYLNVKSSMQAKRLKANMVSDSESIVLTMADQEEVTDEFRGVKVWWACSLKLPTQQTISFYPREEEKMHFKLTFDKKNREVVTKEYLKHVLDEGKAITVKERKRKLYTNNKTDGGYSSRRSMWSHVVFHHPATFDTLAMEPGKKDEIMKDLIAFTNAKDFYAKVGKAWKRGYLLHGPPGTGKSTMIAAMANLLNYDIYDLELTSVKDNTELRKLLIDTSSKSIVVIEDIDCSLDLTGQREKKKKEEEDEKKQKESGSEDDPVKKEKKKLEDNGNKSSQVTLSGLLNFIDGLWSASVGERIIVFTTNYVEKLDPALIRRGRMDKHIELSYCSYEAFKVLARNYLDMDEIDDEEDSFVKVRILLEETKMTPADVAENLMPKSVDEDVEPRLRRLIGALEETKLKAEEEARLKAEEEAKLKAEEEAKLKAEEEARLKAEDEEKLKAEKLAEGIEADKGNGNSDIDQKNVANGPKKGKTQNLENGIAIK